MNNADNKNRYNVLLGNEPNDIAVNKLLNSIGNKKGKVIALAVFEFMQNYNLVEEENPKEKVEFILKNYDYMYALTHKNIVPSSVPILPKDMETEDKPAPEKRAEKKEPELMIPDNNDMIFSKEDKDQAAKLMAVFGIPNETTFS